MAPRADKKIMHDPCPPIMPIRNSKKVPVFFPKSALKISAARMCETVRSMPPIKIDFLGPNFL